MNSTDTNADHTELLRRDAMAIREHNAAVTDATDIGTHTAEAATPHGELTDAAPPLTDELRTWRAEPLHSVRIHPDQGSGAA